MSGFSTVLISIISAIISGTAVAFLSPRFAHSIWKKQKLREQQVTVAERFEKLFSDLHIAGNIRPVPPRGKLIDEKSLENSLKVESRFWEQHALFILTFVLFERDDTLSLGMRLKRMIDDRSKDYPALYSLRMEFLAYMFAEAFGISPEKIAHRSAKLSAHAESTGESQ